MRTTLRLLLPSLFLFAACGGGSPIAGSWAEEKAGGGHGAGIEFDSKSAKFVLHGEGGEAGKHEHDHFNGTWKLVGEAVTLDGEWESNRKKETVVGTLKDGKLTLTFAAGAKTFHQH